MSTETSLNDSSTFTAKDLYQKYGKYADMNEAEIDKLIYDETRKARLEILEAKSAETKNSAIIRMLDLAFNITEKEKN